MSRRSIAPVTVWTLLLFGSVLLKGSFDLTAQEDARPQAQYVYKTIGDRELHVDILYPDNWKKGDTCPAIVFFSGGAWRSGGTAQFRPQAEYFAKRGLVTVRAEYRDRTKDKVEVDTCLKDAISAMRWVRKNAEMLGIDPNRIASSGGSAGGYLAAAVYTTEDYHSPEDDLSVFPKPNAMILFNPVVDLVSLMEHPAVNLNNDKELAAKISPLHNMSQGMPPTLILIGSEDGFFEQVDQFCKKGKDLGIRIEREVYEGQPHAFFNSSPYMAKTAVRADEFLRSLSYLQNEPEVAPPEGKARTEKPSRKKQKQR